MKILLTGNLFFDYESDIREALTEMGHEVDMVFNNIHGPFQIQDIRTIPQYLMYGILPYKLKINYFTERSVERYNRTVQELIRKNSYDLMLVVGAKTIFPETVSLFKGRKVLWFMDGLPRYEYVYPKLPLFDHIFLFEWTDVPLIKEKFNLDSEFMTLGFNPRRYFPVSQPVKYDFSFVGSFYPKRDEYLHALLSISPKMGICGDFYRSEHKDLKEKILKVNAPFSYANKLYNGSKINLNIHHPQSREGLSVRTFEILGAGGFQLVERQRAAVLYFKEGREIELYDSLEEYLDKARYYLEHDAERRKIAEAGYRVALANHTWKARLTQLLTSIQLN